MYVSLRARAARASLALVCASTRESSSLAAFSRSCLRSSCAPTRRVRHKRARHTRKKGFRCEHQAAQMFSIFSGNFLGHPCLSKPLTAATSWTTLKALHVGPRALELLVSIGQLCLESGPRLRAVLGQSRLGVGDSLLQRRDVAGGGCLELLQLLRCKLSPRLCVVTARRGAT